MVTSNISKNERSSLKTLQSIAINGESTQYELKAATHLTYSPIHDAIETLLESKFIHETRQEPHSGPLPKKYYGLTLEGVAMAFLLMSKTPQDIDRICEKWGGLLPLALGKWKFFVTAGLEKEFIEAFTWVAKWILDWGYNTESFATERFWFFIFMKTARETKIKWLKAFRGDPQLKNWASEEMKEWFLEDEELRRIHRVSLDALDVAQEPDWNKVLIDIVFHAPEGSKYAKIPATDQELWQWLTS